MLDAEVTDQPAHLAERSQIDAHNDASVDGYHSGDAPTRHAFVVRGADRRWVAKNLPAATSATTTELPDGRLRFEFLVPGLAPLARFVVGLGGAAHAETTALRELVRSLVEQAVVANAPDGSERPKSQD